MLVNAKEILEKAKESKCAIPQFNVNNLEWAKYILEACQELNYPVILGVSESSIKYMGGCKTVVNLIKGLIDDLKISIPVVLHLDHGQTVEMCEKAVDNGFTSVMIDASKYNLEKNILMTLEVVNYAHSKNVSVEAEVGHIGGSKDITNSDFAYAKVEDCILLATTTKVDFLAPALGSVHGLYKGEPKIDFIKMKQIKERLNIPLVLHGGTGLSDDIIKNSIKNGITKININTELQIVWSNEVKKIIIDYPQEIDPRKIISSGEQAIKNSIKRKIELLKSN